MGSLPRFSKSTKFISMRKLTATLCLIFAALSSNEGTSETNVRFTDPVRIKGSMDDTALIIQLSENKRKFLATIQVGFAKGKCSGFIGTDGIISSDDCVITGLYDGEYAKFSGVFPNFVFNNDNICLGFDDPAQHKHHCIWNYKISFNYPAESVGPLLSGDTKLVEQLQNRILELEKLLEKAKKDVAKRPAPQKPQTPILESTGSGFFVSKTGHILTNEHVVRDCGSVTVGDNANNQVTASIKETDARNDLALLRISSTKMTSAETKSLIRKLSSKKLGLKLVPLASEGLVRIDDVELGEDVLVAGYPYGELFSNSIKVTKGIVSANKGMGDDSGQFQMDAAVQSGNSGGPVYDENGNIVGVVIAQLDKRKVERTIGSLPENVNFGIKASTVRQFLTSAGLPTKWSNRTKRKSTKELAQIAKNQTVMVVCNP